jgi:hypothetical protein
VGTFSQLITLRMKKSHIQLTFQDKPSFISSVLFDLVTTMDT